MDLVKVAVGSAALGYGLFTVFIRAKHPEKFAKLEAMKKAYGEKAGVIVHVIGYTVVPVAVGIFFIITGLKGA